MRLGLGGVSSGAGGNVTCFLQDVLRTGFDWRTHMDIGH